MKLVAFVSITSLVQPNNPGRPTRASLRIGCKPGSKETHLLYQTTQNKTGIYYRIFNNVQKVFTNYMSEGKATIRFQTPEHDLIIKDADRVELRCFILTLTAAAHKKLRSDSLRLSDLSTKAGALKNRTSMRINDRKDYPILKPFPKCLLDLTITGIGLKRIEANVLVLTNLKDLNLSGNALKDLPKSLGNLPSLTSLNLSQNKLSEATDGYDNWTWMKSQYLIRQLRTLDLGHNAITELPRSLSDLKALVQLRLNDNKLQKLPGNIGRLVNLQYFTFANNGLKILPFTILKLKLQTLDISGNMLLTNDVHHTNSEKERKSKEHNYDYANTSLQELAARVMVNNRLEYRYEKNAVPRMIMEYLLTANFCACGSACFSEHELVVNASLRMISNTIINSNDGVLANCNYYCCSLPCSKFKYDKMRWSCRGTLSYYPR